MSAGVSRSVLLTRAVAAVVILTAAVSALQASGAPAPDYRVVAAAADKAPGGPSEKRGPVTVPPLALPPSPGGAALAPGGDLAAPQLAPPAPGGPAAPGTDPPTALGTAPGGVPGAPGGPRLPGAPLVVGPDGADWRPTTTCPTWPAPRPEQQGGLSSMINLAPMAGPFMSEAFALGSVYQPVLSVAGPLLAEIEPIITANLPWINPIIERVQAVLAVVLEAILPFYGPYRQQLLAAEGDLARQLTPILQRWASTPQAVCFVAWQAQIIRNAKGGRSTVASLARPGERIRFSPNGKAVRVR